MTAQLDMFSPYYLSYSRIRFWKGKKWHWQIVYHIKNGNEFVKRNIPSRLLAVQEITKLNAMRQSYEVQKTHDGRATYAYFSRPQD